MTREDKELLLKDLCSRLPYGVKIEVVENNDFSSIEELDCYYLNRVGNNFYSIKPYLFPLSSMTEEQWNNSPRVNLTNFTFESLKCGCFTLAYYTCENDLYDLVEFINWLIKNHFDIYGLIPMNLAIDCTNLNIY